jgi:hypothetical protein
MVYRCDSGWGIVATFVMAANSVIVTGWRGVAAVIPWRGNFHNRHYYSDRSDRDCVRDRGATSMSWKRDRTGIVRGSDAPLAGTCPASG